VQVHSNDTFVADVMSFFILLEKSDTFAAGSELILSVARVEAVYI